MCGKWTSSYTGSFGVHKGTKVLTPQDSLEWSAIHSDKPYVLIFAGQASISIEFIPMNSH